MASVTNFGKQRPKVNIEVELGGIFENEIPVIAMSKSRIFHICTILILCYSFFLGVPLISLNYISVAQFITSKIQITYGICGFIGILTISRCGANAYALLTNSYHDGPTDFTMFRYLLFLLTFISMSYVNLFMFYQFKLDFLIYFHMAFIGSLATFLLMKLYPTDPKTELVRSIFIVAVVDTAFYLIANRTFKTYTSLLIVLSILSVAQLFHCHAIYLLRGDHYLSSQEDDDETDKVDNMNGFTDDDEHSYLSVQVIDSFLLGMTGLYSLLFMLTRCCFLLKRLMTPKKVEEVEDDSEFPDLAALHKHYSKDRPEPLAWDTTRIESVF